MYLRDSLSLIFGDAPAPRGARRRRPAHSAHRLRLESLDERALPSTVTLAPSDDSPLVGDRVTWTATAVDVGATPVYQFSAAPHGGAFHVVRDFSPTSSFTWTPMQEGTYDIEVIAKDDYQATETTSAVVADAVSSRVSGSQAVITATTNPLVAMYSVPPSSSATVFVQFAPAGGHPSWRNTDARVVVPGKSSNFYVAGMLPNTTYQMRHVFSNGTGSAPLLFTTGDVPATLTFPTFTVSQPPGPGSDPDQDMVFHIQGGGALKGNLTPNPLATDLSGRVEWYFDSQQSGLGITNMNTGTLLPGGTVVGLGSDSFSVRNNSNVLREIDLAGNPICETNLAAVNAQLAALGHEAVYGFHHDVQRLPDGNTVVLTWTERTVTINGVSTDYIGEMLLVLDQDFQVRWAWDAFDHLDVNRGPVLGEGAEGPELVVPRLPAVGWLHVNAVSLSPTDGNLVLSMRNQDWVIKIDYRNGAGDGHVVWRLGQGGDFAVNSADTNPWFSHQHNAHYIDDHTFILFDNGNTRRASDPNAHSRGQVWTLDETGMTATPVLNADLGDYSNRLGGAQRLSNGNYQFTSGAQGLPFTEFAQETEVLPDGTKTYVLETDHVRRLMYRSFRIRTLYEGTDDVLAGAPRNVESVVINDGSAQRSMVNSIAVTFGGAAVLDPGAIELRRQDGTMVNFRLDVSTVGGKTVAALTFPGTEFVGGSLADGRYSLTVRSDRVHDRWGRELDGNSDGFAGGNRSDSLFRLFGDSDGDGDVDLRDLGRFLGSLGRQAGDPQYLWYFDVNGDDRIGVIDVVAFARRLGSHLGP